MEETKHKAGSMNYPRSGLALYFSRHIEACLLSLGRLAHAPIANLMVFMVIGIALALPSGLLVLLKNLEVISQNWDNNPSITLYLKQDTSEAQLSSLMRKIKQQTTVENLIYISPQQALNELQKQANLSEALSALATNPLPGAIVVTPYSPEPNQVNQLFAAIKQLPGIDIAQIDTAWVQKFNALVILAKRIIYALALLLGIGVLLIIGNIIHLALQNYRSEIEVYQLVGATKGYIRRPFLYTGVLYGFLGGCIACVIINTLLLALHGPAERLAALYSSDFTLSLLNFRTSFSILGCSILLGLIGAWFAFNRHQNIEQN